MNNFIEQDVSLEKCPALVLNADYRPLSYYPSVSYTHLRAHET